MHRFTNHCSRLWQAFEDAVLPLRCAFCGLAAGRDALCDGCEHDLVHNQPACRGCALPLPAAATGAVASRCGACLAQPLPFTAVVAPLVYTYPLDAAIHGFKFRRKLYYAPAFAGILCRAAATLPQDIDAIQPVPLHRWRLLRRGFNQAVELASPLAERLSLPLLDAVCRRRATPYQSGLAAAERRRNLARAFVMPKRINARHVLLVDDVMTTGSTCGQLARLLLDNGVGAVSVLALARALTH